MRRFRIATPSLSLLLPLLSTALLCHVSLFGTANTGASAQTRRGEQAKTDAEAPVFHDYKGVSIGMSVDEARKKLGSPAEKGDEQDFFVVSDTETVQVFYDKLRKVSAVSINYLGEDAGIPKPKAVLGTEIEVKPDGSIYKLLRFPKAGYWVSYSRTAGDAPLITITMKKMDQ